MGRLESRRVGGNSARLGMDSACDVYDYMLVVCILHFYLNVNERGTIVHMNDQIDKTAKLRRIRLQVYN